MANGYGNGGVMPSAETDFFEGDPFYDQDDNAPPSSPEVELFLAVVARVWGDAWTATDTWLKNSDRRCEPDIVRAEARRWLLLDFGDWREDREEVCAKAGLDPDAVRKAALRRRELAVVEDAERYRRERESIDRAMASLVEREHRMTLGRVNRVVRELATREERLALA